jgi:hypothetical protein
LKKKRHQDTGVKSAMLTKLADSKFDIATSATYALKALITIALGLASALERRICRISFYSTYSG